MFALERVPVEQRQEQLVVGLDAPVRRRRHEEQVPRALREQPAQPIPRGVARLAAEVVGGHLVRLVAYHEVVGAVRRPEPRLHLVVAGQHVHPDDALRRLQEPVAGSGGVPLVARQDGEVETEPFGEFLLPLFDQTAGADDEASAGVAARQQFLDEQPGHDRLAGAGVVGEQETQRLARQHRLIDRGDLVRQRIHLRGLHREQRVEEVRERDPLGLGGQAEERAVAVETPGPLFLGEFEAVFVAPVEQAFIDGAPLVAEDQRDGVGAVALHADHGYRAGGDDAAHGRAGGQRFEFHRGARRGSAAGGAAAGVTRSRIRNCRTRASGRSR